MSLFSAVVQVFCVKENGDISISLDDGLFMWAGILGFVWGFGKGPS